MKYTRSKLSRFSFRRLRAIGPLARAVMVVSTVAVMATGITYAALYSQNATLTGNSISSATADLRIGSTASTFYATRTGFAFNNIIPGNVPAATDGSIFYLKNYSGGAMSIRVSVTGTPANPAQVDFNKVHFVFNRNDGSIHKISLAALIAANTSGGAALPDPLVGGSVGQYRVQVTMDDEAFTGQSAAISGIDLSFVGYSQGNAPAAQ